MGFSNWGLAGVLGQSGWESRCQRSVVLPTRGHAVYACCFPNAATLLHESGHAMHFYRSFQAQQSLWNFGGPEEFQEFVAIGMDMLGWPYYDQAMGGFYTTTESRAGCQSVLRFYLEALVDGVMEDAGEHFAHEQYVKRKSFRRGYNNRPHSADGAAFLHHRLWGKDTDEYLNQLRNVEGLQEKVGDAHRTSPWFNALMCRNHYNREGSTKHP